jgi:hypothetical protein
VSIGARFVAEAADQVGDASRSIAPCTLTVDAAEIDGGRAHARVAPELHLDQQRAGRAGHALDGQRDHTATGPSAGAAAGGGAGGAASSWPTTCRAAPASAASGMRCGS